MVNSPEENGRIVFELVKKNNGVIPYGIMQAYRSTGKIDLIGMPGAYSVREICKFAEHYRKEFGYVPITLNFIDVLASYIGCRKVLSVMSGLCALEWHLIQRGIYVTCSDNMSWFDAERFNEEHKKSIENFIVGDAEEVVRNYAKGHAFVLMSWPPFKRDSAERVLKAMRETNPNCMMIYIGEDQGGCCATDGFFELAEAGKHSIPPKEREEFQQVKECYRSFWGIHDYPQLFK